MKNLWVMFLTLAMVFSGCSLSVEVGDDEVEQEAAEESTNVGEEEEALDEFSKDETIVAGSSELEDNSGYGFAYNASNVFDLDFSTAWCGSGEESVPTLTITLPGKTKLDKVGIVSGFARDEAIFNQNNRVKTMEVWYGDYPEALAEFQFDDEYAMQFFELPEEATDSVKLKITEVYEGSKYDDTCIAEVDFWSDWVETEDAVAAENYYIEHKEGFATRPVGVSSIEVCEIENLNSCGAIIDASALGYAFEAKNENHLAVSARMNEQAKEGDEITFKWLHTAGWMPAEDFEARLMHTESNKVEECADGLYASSDYKVNTLYEGIGGFVVKAYFNGRLIGRKEFSIAQ